MVSDPIEYQIVRNLQAALALIAVASGYHYTVGGTAVKLDPNQGVEALIAPGGPRPFIVLEVLPETWTYLQYGGVKLVLPVTVHWVHDSTPTDDLSHMKTFFNGCADVEQAIAVSTGRGGLAIDTRIVKRTLETALDGAQVWASIDLEIALERTYGQPNG